jgi:hypothetical protein
MEKPFRWSFSVARERLADALPVHAADKSASMKSPLGKWSFPLALALEARGMAL